MPRLSRTLKVRPAGHSAEGRALRMLRRSRISALGLRGRFVVARFALLALLALLALVGCAATVETYETPEPERHQDAEHQDAEHQDAGPPLSPAVQDHEPDPGPAWWCCSPDVALPPPEHDCSAKPTTCPSSSPVRWCNTSSPPIGCN